MNNFKIIFMFLIILINKTGFSQGDENNTTEEIIIFVAERNTSPAYRISSSPNLIDTVIPIPSFTYPLLTKSMETTITVEDIAASKIKIIGKLDKLYPGYVKLGLGNYLMPLGEVYYNSMRNRKMSYGIHSNHLSSFGNLKEYAPTQFDKTSAKIFGDFYLPNHIIKSELNYLNNGYHYYGLKNDSIPQDSLSNRIAAYNGSFKFSNQPYRDSGKVLYDIYTDYNFFHEFNKDTAKLSQLNVRESNVVLGTKLKYQHMDNWFALQADILLNYYKYGETTAFPITDRRDSRNNIFSLKPTITSFQFNDKLRAEVGLDLNFDLNDKDNILKPIVIAKAQYALLKGVLIPYAGLDGDLHQNSYYSFYQKNPFLNTSIDIKNTKVFNMYVGLKGSFSKSISYNITAYSKVMNDQMLFFNDTTLQGAYKFDMVYDKVTATGIRGSITYQKDDKLKVDGYTELNRYVSFNEKHAWNMPELVVGLRGAYNLYNKIIIKSDLRFEGGRKSPGGLLSTEQSDEKYNLGLLADVNLQAEYRYTKRLSAFIQFNNIANQMYQKWYNYPVFGFQVLGGVTFGF